ncbi:hypothetical protein DIPPA_14587 [Diplonema papillatum]|nr:hypothetical protein DIPPA_14587 [Diplonema papillatum]
MTRPKAPALLLVKGVLALLLYVAAFYAGVRLGTKPAPPPAADIAERLADRSAALEEQIQACQVEVRSWHKTGGAGDNALAGKEASRKSLQKTWHRLHNAFDKCQKDTRAADAVTAKRQEKEAVVKRQAHLRSELARFGTAGQDAIVLSSLMGDLTAEHQRLRRALGLPAVEVTDDYLYERMYEISLNPDLRDQFYDRQNEVQPVRPGELDDFPRVAFEPFTADAAQLRQLFVAQRVSADGGADAQWTEPSWNGHSARRNSTRGLHVGAALVGKPVSYLVTLLERLYDYALCAAARNLSDFLFPGAFTTRANETVALPSLVATPFVSFCEDCVLNDKSTEFRFLCLGAAVKQQYGSLLFWRVRSRIVVSDSVRNAAARFIAENDAHQAVAVRVLSDAENERCHWMVLQQQEPLLFFSRVLSDNSTGVPFVRVYADATSPKQCIGAGAGSDLVARVVPLKEAHKASKVFVVGDLKDEQWASLENDFAAQGTQVVRIVRGSYATEAEAFAVEMTVAAGLKGLLVSRNDPTSAFIVETYLINHGFAPEAFDAISVW